MSYNFTFIVAIIAREEREREEWLLYVFNYEYNIRYIILYLLTYAYAYVTVMLLCVAWFIILYSVVYIYKLSRCDSAYHT